MSRELDEYHLCVNASNDLLGEKEKLGDEQARSQAQLPQLYTLLRHGQNLKSLVLALVMIDLAAMPITYYYALRYGTDMTLRQGKLLSYNSLDCMLLILSSDCYGCSSFWIRKFYTPLCSFIETVAVKVVNTGKTDRVDEMGNRESPAA